MKQAFFFFLLMFLCTGTSAQSFADKELERIVSGELAEEISTLPEEELRYAGVVVMEVATGNVVANVSLFYKDGDFIRNPHGNTQYVPSGLGRSVLYLAMMPDTDPYMVQDVGDGLYIDSSGCAIEDHNHKRGGYLLIDLKRAFALNSDIGILKASEKVWDKDMMKCSDAIKDTGISMGGRALTGYGTNWQSHDILGHSALMSLLQQVCWCNAIAGGKFFIRKDIQDAILPYDSISNKEGLDSLRSAMRECVTDGLGRRMNSEFVTVAAMTNVSQKDADGYKGQFAAAFFPYEEPKYTIGVYIWRKWSKGYANPSDVARHIIDWIACNRLSLPPYLSLTENQSIKHRDGWVHPAAR